MNIILQGRPIFERDKNSQTYTILCYEHEIEDKNQTMS